MRGEPLTSEDVRRLDENAQLLGLTALQLMENAGRSVADIISSHINIKGKNVVVICGLGNNGGDGFVVARHLANKGAHVDVILVGSAEMIRTDEARHNWAILEGMELSIRLHEARSTDEVKEYKDKIMNADVVVDAIFGIGFKGTVREPYRTAIELMNKSKGFKVAVDIPSGIDADTGEIGGIAFKADLTVTFHAPKVGLDKAKEYVGKVVVADIGIPKEAEYIVGLYDVRKCFKTRDPLSKKGDNGRVLIIGGSRLYSGAPALSGMAALRAGIDIAVITTPKSAAWIIKTFSPALIVWPLKSDEYLGLDDIEYIMSVKERFDCIILGPGLGLNEETMEAVREIVRTVDKPMVIDADGLKALKDNLDLIRNKQVVITPHAGEFAIVTGINVSNMSWNERMEIVKEIARKYNITILLKGKLDIISDGKKVRINCTGNASMTVGGTGDTLTGIIGAMLSRGINTFDAACAAAFINGLAGELASEKYTYITPLDLVQEIPEAIRIACERKLIIPSRIYRNLLSRIRGEVKSER
ncbi:MAG: bifunctional ADP-dependent NAD(P)H-hydrate dehydratase/NAD(P)H-hydrate epimerase [Thermoprotei archaeon]|nr:MAG: bifunctional ADP-dependent NAD(P)H-hydrate dehydratase/NAD(P)H-hydrate epimerase [Thermoprotei archaeon]RLF19119.1 MAG: bifunctional ADP-dependent NAD(P)H-hydrate dehydratase/NAD(P)H-hydrate epimerase [Thermoprotei archaeon]